MPSGKITNGDFSAGETGWTVNNPTGGAAPSVFGGAFYFNGSNEAVYGDSIEQTFSAPVGETQTVTMDLIESNGGTATHTFQIDILDSSGTVIETRTYDVLDDTTVNVNFTFVPTTATSTIRITNTTSTSTTTTDGQVDNVSIICFANGTTIETISGPVAVENLSAGMLVKTFDGGLKPLRLALSRTVDCKALSNEKLWPVRILAGALGHDLPKSDLLVSRQHRMLVVSKTCQRIFGTEGVLVPAISLTELPGIYVDQERRSVEYFHLVFDNHEVIFANGAPSESFFPGPFAIDALTDEARDELFDLFPHWSNEAAPPELATIAPKGAKQKALLSRHRENGIPLLENLPAAFLFLYDQVGAN